MDRATFLLAFWKKGVKPILLVLAIYFCISFIYQVFIANGRARGLILLVLALAIILLLLELIVSLFIKINTALSARIPENLKIGLSLIFKYVSPIILVVVIYQAWLHDWIGTVIIVSVLFVQKIISTLHERKVSKRS
jgi:hypothetical protein